MLCLDATGESSRSGGGGILPLFVDVSLGGFDDVDDNDRIDDAEARIDLDDTEDAPDDATDAADDAMPAT